MANKKVLRLSNTEMQLRVEYVTDQIAKGLQRSVIQDEIIQRYHVKPSTARIYIRKALDRVGDLMSQQRGKQLAKVLLRYEHLYKVSIEAGDLKTAKGVLDSQVKLLSLDRKVQSEEKQIDVVSEYEIEDAY